MARGYGFIKVDGQNQEVFVHITHVEDKDRYLKEGERVSFVIVQGKKGLEAQYVRRTL